MTVWFLKNLDTPRMVFNLGKTKVPRKSRSLRGRIVPACSTRLDRPARESATFAVAGSFHLRAFPLSAGFSCVLGLFCCVAILMALSISNLGSLFLGSYMRPLPFSLFTSLFYKTFCSSVVCAAYFVSPCLPTLCIGAWRLFSPCQIRMAHVWLPALCEL